MIERYQRPAMAAIWSLASQYEAWLEVELAAVKTQAEMGLIPAAEAEEIVKKAAFDIDRIAEIEAAVKHDVIAFVTSVEEHVGPAARYFHYGLTSSDVLDTSLALRLRRASTIIRQDLVLLLESLRDKAVLFKDCPVIGRSHGIHAEPTTFGLKMAFFYAEFERALRRFDAAAENIAVGQISGPVGNYSASSLSPEMEEKALAKLGLKPTPVSSQIVSRDVHADFFQALALVATCVEHLAVEIRLLARTEVGEVEEAFGRGQKGSSAMPHKKNPILSENLSGLARVVRSLAQAALDDVVLWHERDISHSSAERIIAPDATVLLDFMLARAKGLVDGLVVKPERMQENLSLTKGLYNSQEILLALCRSGLSRVEAYALVQDKAMAAAAGRGDFKTLVAEDKEISGRLKPGELDEIFDGKRFSRHVSEIFKRLNLE
ncbi:MAG: adenylosuccinate lyase [Deltaproteobacteria bacterium]|jgi:adenylosuccinate lyase|nr:adenylosuccinate lyase [Deltaproteobacteria bacterium]